MACLIWGPSGAGKTTFAATAPGEKIWLSFGDQEHVSVRQRKDVHVAKLYDLSLDELFKHAQSDNPFGLDQMLAAEGKFQTVVVDSVTAISFRALQRAVANGVGAGRGFKPSMETPGISAYGARNAIVLETLTGLLRVTAKHNVNLILTAHEADPVTSSQNGQDIIEYIGIQLGGQLVNNTTWRLSEIWYMSQEETGEKMRRIAIRPTRRRRPMKTRMFTSQGEAEFKVRYDAEKPDKGQHTIASWLSDWEKGGGKKLAIPK
jgi:RecA/RadA recombinase